MKTRIWAHRGASAYAPENSMEAFELAGKMGAEGIELDVHLTKDDQLVVAHDETVDRCSNGSGRIVDMTLLELLKLDFSNGRPGYSDIKIPTLEQVLLFIKQSGLYLNIEIKNGIVLYERIEEKIIKMVDKIGLKDRVIYSSFNHYSLVLIRKLDPSAKIGILYSEAMIDPFIYAQHLKADAIHPYFATLMVPGVLEGCKKHGIAINAWTADKQDDLLWMFKSQVDAVITNRPDDAVKIRRMFSEK